MPVFVLDRYKRPLMPCSPKCAHALLAAWCARLHRLFPFCIRFADRLLEISILQQLRVPLDPGSKTTGPALYRNEDTVDPDDEPVVHSQFQLALAHRVAAIRNALHVRAAMRRRRRGNLRHRALRFSNRTRRLLQHAVGYNYARQPTFFPQSLTEAATAKRSSPVLPALKDRLSRSNI